MPPLEEYTEWLSAIWNSNRITNNGPLVQQLERELSATLDGLYVQLTTNGTTALQLALQALQITGEVITTPFSFVATTTSILWEACTPVFVDIDPDTLCIDARLIEAAITPRTQAILATHVYGYPCDVETIAAVARRYNLKVLYDGAHAFGARYNGRSLLSYGDLTACSFHATKLFHMGEGGAVVTQYSELAEKIGLLKSFGYNQDEHHLAGINGKASEIHAALGLCLLPRVPAFIHARSHLYALYREELAGLPLAYPHLPDSLAYNYAYFPVIFATHEMLVHTQQALARQDIETRRYFFPSLNTLPYLPNYTPCPVSEAMSMRVLCLPFYQQLQPEQVRLITTCIRLALSEQPTTAA
nr:DegT/DnrJ/EryC1/StrS family aminotransferase [Hymenobacter pini]